jgi:hypothetical protein
MPHRSTLVLAVLILLIPAGTASAFEFNVTAGLDHQGSFKLGELDEVIDYDSSAGFTLGLELEFDVPLFEFGVGLEYGFPRDSGCSRCTNNIDYRLLYGIVRFHVLGPFYLAGRVGYTDVSIDDLGDGEISGKESWGAGVGFSLFDKLKFELLLNNISAKAGGIDIDYETYSARAIYSF